MTRMKALGQALAMEEARVAQIPALMFCPLAHPFREDFAGEDPTHKEVISSHSWLSGDTSGDDDNVTVLESSDSSIVSWKETGNLSRGGNVREIGSDLSVSVNAAMIPVSPTPAALTTSYNESSVIRGLSLSKRERG